jgi:hypothetical protein
MDLKDWLTRTDTVLFASLSSALSAALTGPLSSIATLENTRGSLVSRWNTSTSNSVSAVLRMV